MSNVAVIFAGGTGQRMNTRTRPKQFLELHGKPIIIYTLEEFEHHAEIDGIIVVMLESWIAYTQDLISKYNLKKVKKVVPGGASGQDSIYNGLCAAAQFYGDDDIVLIHDGVRPLVDEETITANIRGVEERGTAITVTAAIETITMKDGVKFVISVTDPPKTQTQISSDLTNFLTKVIIQGATQNSDGRYEVKPGTDYSLIANFAESTEYQFRNNAELTYQMPQGIAILSEQTGPLKINIVYKGSTYEVDASYRLTTDGQLTVKFDESDPDYSKLVSSTNVRFRFTYSAQFDGSSTEIKFNDVVERDIIFDEPEPGQAYVSKNAQYDEKTGRFTYTIKVNATGDVTNVNVKDVLSGNALVFNNDVRVSGNSSDYTDKGAANVRTGHHGQRRQDHCRPD